MNGTVILNGTEGYPVICQVSGFEIVAVSKVFQTPEGQRETGIIHAEENVYIRRYESGISFLPFYVEALPFALKHCLLHEIDCSR